MRVMPFLSIVALERAVGGDFGRPGRERDRAHTTGALRLYAGSIQNEISPTPGGLKSPDNQPQMDAFEREKGV